MPEMGQQAAIEWRQLTNRLMGVVNRDCTNRGYAIVSVEFLVHPDGHPVVWTEPKVTKLEPRLGAYEFLEKVIQLLGNGKHPEQHIDKPKD